MALTTMKGEAFWAYIFAPDTKFNPDGDFKLKFRAKGDAAVKLQEKVDTLLKESLEKAKEANKGKKIKQADAPYHEVYNDNDEPTGELEFTFKQKAVIPTKNGPMKKRVMVVDAKGNLITEHLKVGNGSVVKVAYDPNLYFTPTAGAGVSLRLTGVQIIELKEYEGGNSLGFGEEEGYEHKDNNNGSNDATDEDEDEFFETESKDEEDF